MKPTSGVIALVKCRREDLQKGDSVILLKDDLNMEVVKYMGRDTIKPHILLYEDSKGAMKSSGSIHEDNLCTMHFVPDDKLMKPHMVSPNQWQMIWDKDWCIKTSLSQAKFIWAKQKFLVNGEVQDGLSVEALGGNHKTIYVLEDDIVVKQTLNSTTRPDYQAPEDNWYQHTIITRKPIKDIMVITNE